MFIFSQETEKMPQILQNALLHKLYALVLYIFEYVY